MTTQDAGRCTWAGTTVAKRTGRRELRREENGSLPKAHLTASGSVKLRLEFRDARSLKLEPEVRKTLMVGCIPVSSLRRSWVVDSCRCAACFINVGFK